MGSRKIEIYLSDELADLIEEKAKKKNISVAQFLPEYLTKSFARELSADPGLSNYSDYLSMLVDAILKYSLELDSLEEFQLRNIPFYNDIPDSIRIRIARSINKLISQHDSDLNSVVERVMRSDGSPKISNGTAVYRRRFYDNKSTKND